ncbi:MAG TPA: hypothetical protein VF960_00685 [Chloroflexota bacterium]
MKKSPSKARLWLRALVALALMAGTIALRIPFASRTLFAWDSANFALALTQYNVAFHQPHPPGYPLYVGIASVLDSWLADANLSFVVISIAASGLAVAALYLLVASMYDPWTGFVAAVLLGVGVGFWGYGEVAYPYTSLAFFGVLVASLCWMMWRGHRSVAVLSGLILGISGGIRQDTLLFLGPLWLVSVWGTGVIRFILSTGVLGLTVAAWLYPAAVLSGGWAVFAEASVEQGYLVLPTSSAIYQGIDGLRHNSLLLVHSLDVMFGATALVVLYGLGRFLTFRGVVADQRLRFLLLWFIPPVLVYAMFHIGEPGYVLSIVPVLCIVAAVTVHDISHDVRSALTLLASKASALRFLSSAAWTVGVATAVLIVSTLVAWNANAFVRTSGPARWSEISSIDAIISGQVEYARQFAPNSVVIVAKERYRQMQYYLRGYDIQLLYNEFVPDYSSARYSYRIPAGVGNVLVLDFGKTPSQLPQAAGGEVTISSGPWNPVKLWNFQVKPGDTIEYGYDYFGIKGGR